MRTRRGALRSSPSSFGLAGTACCSPAVPPAHVRGPVSARTSPVARIPPGRRLTVRGGVRLLRAVGRLPDCRESFTEVSHPGRCGGRRAVSVRTSWVTACTRAYDRHASRRRRERRSAGARRQRAVADTRNAVGDGQAGGAGSKPTRPALELAGPLMAHAFWWSGRCFAPQRDRRRLAIASRVRTRRRANLSRNRLLDTFVDAPLHIPMERGFRRFGSFGPPRASARSDCSVSIRQGRVRSTCETDAPAGARLPLFSERPARTVARQKVRQPCRRMSRPGLWRRSADRTRSPGSVTPEDLIARHVVNARGQLAAGHEGLKGARGRVVNLEERS